MLGLGLGPGCGFRCGRRCRLRLASYLQYPEFRGFRFLMKPCQFGLLVLQQRLGVRLRGWLWGKALMMSRRVGDVSAIAIMYTGCGLRMEGP